ncbi:MAG: CvpA family protein [Saprospiraceae bacterium]
MTWIDIGFVLIVLVAGWQGSSQGIIGVLATVFFFAFGLVIAIRATPFTASILKSVSNSDNAGFNLLAFAVNLVVLWLLSRILKSGLDQILATLYLSALNKLAGAAAGALFGLLLYSAVIWFLDGARLINQQTKEASTFYDTLAKMPDYFKDYGGRILPYIKETWQTSMGLIDEIDRGRQTDNPKAAADGEARIEKLPNNYKREVQDDPERGRRPGNGIEY